MRKIFVILMGFILVGLLSSTALLWADCVQIAGYNSYIIEGDKKIIFYRGSSPIAVVTLQDCKVYPQSDIRLTKAYMCESDKIIIDGQACNIFSLESMQ
jgi:hypothetical protein